MLKPFAAPKRWILKDPDTGFMHIGNNRGDLISRINSYREQNALPSITYVEAVIENYLCQLPENAMNCQFNTKMKRSAWGYLKGGISLLMEMAFGEENMVDEVEATRRAEICVKCPFNIVPDGQDEKTFRVWSDMVAIACKGKHKATPHDAKLNSCAICTCPIQAKVFFREAILSKEESERAPKECWQKRTN